MSITLEEIKRDCENLINIIGNVTTIEQLKELENKEIFGYIEVDNKGYYSVHDYDNNGEYIENPHYCEGYTEINNIESHILYGEYGCLGAIFVAVNNGEIKDIYFDIWEDEYAFIIAEQVTIDEVNEDNFEMWMDDLKDFIDYCEAEEKEWR